MHPVITVVGASGGLGGSTFAALLAAAAVSRGTPAVLVDADLGGGGIDSTVAVEHRHGLRWADLTEIDGAVDGARLRAALPEGEVPVLAGSPGGRPGLPAQLEVLRALAREGAVVVDAPRAVAAPWCREADLVVLLCGLRPRRVRDGEAAVDELGLDGTTGRAVLVTRGTPRASVVADQLASHLCLPLLDHLPDDDSLVRDEARGRAPRARGLTAEVVGAVLDQAGVDALRVAS